MRYEIPPPANKYKVWVQGYTPIRGMLVAAETAQDVLTKARMHAIRWKADSTDGDPNNWKPLHPWLEQSIRNNNDLNFYRRYGVSDRDGTLGIIADHQMYYTSVYDYPTLTPKTGEFTYIPRPGVRPTSRNQFTVIKHAINAERWKRLPVGAVDWERTRMHSSFMKPDGEWVVLEMIGTARYALEYEAFIASLHSNYWIGSYDPSR